MAEHVLWTERYRPKTIEDCVLPESIKAQFRNFVERDEIPNLLLTGKPGTGKTTIAKSMIDQVHADFLFINASKDGGIDTLRTTIMDYASRMSLESHRKFVIMDEADDLTDKTQKSLRSFIEEYSKYCGFILTGNYKARLIEPLRKRLINIDFKMPAKNTPEWQELVKKATKVSINILKENNVPYDAKSVLLFVMSNYPDMRSVVNGLQQFANHGGVTEDIVNLSLKNNFTDLYKYLKNKDFAGMVRWVDENRDVEYSTLIDAMYSHYSENDLDKAKLPALIYHMNDYDYKNAFVTDTTLNSKAMLMMVMNECF